MSIDKGLWEQNGVSAASGYDAASLVRVPDLRHAGDWIVGLVAAAVLAAPVVCYGDISYFGENALIELGQCGLLWAAGVLFAVAAARARDQMSVLSLLWLSLFNLTLLVRELDVDGSRFEPWLTPVFDKDLDYVVIGIAVIALFALSLGRIRGMARSMLLWAWKGPGRLFILGGVFYLLGDLGEKRLISDDRALNLVFEESMELLGTLCLFICAHATLRRRSIFSSSPQTP